MSGVCCQDSDCDHVTQRCRCLSPGVSQIDRIVEVVEETLKGNTIHMLAKKSLPRLDLPKVYSFASPAWAVEALVVECSKNPCN
jgi:hypothetical protein